MSMDQVVLHLRLSSYCLSVLPRLVWSSGSYLSVESEVHTMLPAHEKHTLWERWTGKVKPDPRPLPEDRIFNALKLHSGDYIEVKVFGDPTLTYTVSEIREYERRISGSSFTFTDYLLQSGETQRILRAVPKEGHTECELVLLSSFYEGEFDENILIALKDSRFIVHNANASQEVYDVLNSGPEGYSTTIKTATGDTVTIQKIRYWDYYRAADTTKGEIASGTVFFFVEVSDKTGYITMYKGYQITGRDVTIYPQAATTTT